VSVAVLSGWLAAAALSIAWFCSLRRFRLALNKCIHEMRRPLQQAFLLSPGRGNSEHALAGAMERTLAALDDLDARANNRSLPLERRPVDVRRVVEGCLDLRQGVSMSERPYLRWNAHRSKVLGDPDRLRRVFDNLIENAAKHGSPPIWISADGDARSLRVAVGNAPGISDHSGAPASESIPGRANGHGLDIVRDLVGEHGGRLKCRQHPAGYEAVVELPVSRV
jgi:signal transduction histidine kinase